MRDILRIVGFPLIIVGTFGLLFNEFVTDWGSAATIAFACLNLLGLIALGSAPRVSGKGKSD